MTQRTHKRWILLATMLGVILLIALVIASSFQQQSTQAADAPDESIPTYFPVINQTFPPESSLFGVEFTAAINAPTIQDAKNASNYWVRWGIFDWSKIEEVQGDYNWSVLPEQLIMDTAGKGMKIIGIIKNVPAWAQIPGGKICGPINSANLNDFADFVTRLVQRYKGSVHYWELGNEPDVDPDEIFVDFSQFGCWGDSTDPYYGGGYYAEMLKIVYPAIKAADPNAKVLIGGLLLDCDPTNPPDHKDCLPSRFFEGILRNSGAPYFDIVSFHGYPYYDGTRPVDETFVSWQARGGVVAGKVDFLREVMAAFGVNKPIFHTENALICPETLPFCNAPTEEFFQDQADYVVKSYLRSFALDLEVMIWYTFNNGGWRYSGMLDVLNTPKPAYHTYDFMTKYMQNAQYLNEITSYPGIQGYRFQKGSQQIWALWSADGTPLPFAVPAGASRILNRDGGELTLSASITVQRPVYIEVNP
jgi:hypothetical protein